MVIIKGRWAWKKNGRWRTYLFINYNGHWVEALVEVTTLEKMIYLLS